MTSLRARVAALLIAPVLVASGCSAVNPITTQFDYAASDGLQVQVGDVFGHNLLIVASDEGEPAILTGSLSNGSRENASVQISIDAATSYDVEVPAGQSVFLGPAEGQELIIGTASARPGLLAIVSFVIDGVGTVNREVPVVDGTFAPYAELLAGIPSPEPSPSPSPDSSPEPSVEPSIEPSVSPSPDSE